MFRNIAIFYLVIAQSAGLAITLDSQDARIGVEIDIFSRDGVLPSQDYQSNISIFSSLSPYGNGIRVGIA